ncbi:MAG TPA: tRNA (guanosine(46)-N7)-methyltransferase TrmB, partial [Lachnospiraceae bacterium]|nr:tRNA (guanosine(46)-N7)-methyltransferase TrmB [Lachnospiraceae bacterium]
MRLRNIPRAEGTIQAHLAVIKRPEAQKGCWRQVFGN